MRLSDKTTLVLGGTRGIGRGIAETFAREGARSIFAGRDVNEGTGIARDLQKRGYQSEFRQCDVQNLESLNSLIGRVIEEYGRLNALVNSAGTNVGHSLFEATEEEYELLFDLNVRSVFFAMKWGAVAMSKTGGGSIINVTSSAATKGYADRTLYCGTKAAVLMMSKAAALDAAKHRVRINCISPGAVDTPLFRSLHFSEAENPDQLISDYGRSLPLGRVGSVRDIAAAAVFLASDDAAWVTGLNMNVDGGEAI